jgi:hypothetical protein
MLESSLPVYLPKEGWQGWNNDLPGFQGLCAEKPVRSYKVENEN